MVKTKKSLQITRIELKNFRCFEKLVLDIKQPIVLFEGVNGNGKTSLLEALYYTCYLKSFRTHTPRDLIRFDSDSFFVKVDVHNDWHGQSFEHEIQVGFSQGKRIVKVDGSSVSSYKELMNHIRVVSLTEDDLALIKEGPIVRRTFLDQAILLMDPDYALLVKEFRQVVNNRNALLQHRNVDQHTYDILTQQLWNKSQGLQNARIKALGLLADRVSHVIATYFENRFLLNFSYRPKKKAHGDLDVFMKKNLQLKHDEMRFCRSLFGAHLDDFTIHFQEKNSRSFASRGQQKLAVLLLKINLFSFEYQVEGLSHRLSGHRDV